MKTVLKLAILSSIFLPSFALAKPSKVVAPRHIEIQKSKNADATKPLGDSNNHKKVVVQH